MTFEECYKERPIQRMLEPKQYAEYFFTAGLKAGMEKAAEMCDERAKKQGHITSGRKCQYADAIRKSIEGASNG